MGGANVTPHLVASGHPGIASDAHPALMAMYQAVAAGWEPPTKVSKEEWTRAKGLPDSDPLKAFCGFCCSFNGVYQAGYVDREEITNAKTQRVQYISRAASGSRALLKSRKAFAATALACVSFLSVVPEQGVDCLYCDPPYQGTTGYKGHDAFDHDLFWQLCQKWASLGSRVFVSEYSCPVPHDVVWQKNVASQVGPKARGTASSALGRTEKLFRILPKGNV